MNTRKWRDRWLTLSVRHKLMVFSLLPLIVVLPLLVAALVVWGSSAYDQLLITKVRSDLAVARGYFGQLQTQVGTGTQAVASSHRLHVALAQKTLLEVHDELTQAQVRLGFDFINLYTPNGQLVTASWQPPNTQHTALDALVALPHAAQANTTPHLALPTEATYPAQLQRLSKTDLLALAPHLAHRLDIALLATQSAASSERTVEDRGLVIMTRVPVIDVLTGKTLAWLQAGVLVNQNLGLVDDINQVVYPPGSLPMGGVGTVTLFLDDVRVTTNVRLFQNQRAIGTRVSQAVRDAVLLQGDTWLDRAFVVNDWYVSGYEPLLNHQGDRVGMLYVGYLETPYRLTKYTMLAIIVGLFAAIMAAAAWWSLRWARHLFEPVGRMNHTMQQVQDGHPNARVGPLTQKDELGALAGHLDALLQTVDDKTCALKRLNDALDQKVTERTHALQLAQAQLVKTEKLAAIGQITASVAHEINNPIAVIQGNLDLLRDTLGDQALPVQPELKLIDQQIERMRLIVTQLLQHARPNDYAGYVTAVDVNDCVRDALGQVAHRIHPNAITVEQQLFATAIVPINRQELLQVLVNLLTNAIQAMPDGGKLTVRSLDQTNAQGHDGVCIEVGDTGPGLSQSTTERLFSPFFTTKPNGNGLGLWISMGLLERYGGSISASNHCPTDNTHNGAVFAVWLRCESFH